MRNVEAMIRRIMKVNGIREAITIRIRELDRLIKELGDINSYNATETNVDNNSYRIKIVNKPSGYQYYKVKKGSNSPGKYIPKDIENQVASILQREYNQKVYTKALNEKRYLEDFLNHYDSNDIPDSFSNLHPGRKALITPIDMSEEDYAKYWQEVTYEAKPIGEGRTFSETLKGEKVRSKSEALIADTLMARGIPYHYEKPLILNNNLKIHPDFTVLNVRKKKTIYLEHLGMVDERGYLTDAIDRLEQYEKNGIILGDNLLVTYETERRPLKRSMVESIIRNHLL